jgi:hypothetical protein
MEYGLQLSVSDVGHYDRVRILRRVVNGVKSRHRHATE